MTNDAVKGYAIVAMKREGLNNAQIERIIEELECEMSENTEKEAERVYIKFCMGE